MQKISVAICTYNRERYLNQLFNSIIRQTLDKELFEVILIDNNSPGNTRELFQIFSEVNPYIKTRYELEKNQGLSYARNRAIQIAEYDFITFLDDDAFIQEDYLEKCLLAFSENPRIDVLGGKIILHYESIIPDWENKYLNSILGYFNRGEQAFTFDKKAYPRGSNMTFKRAVFSKIGLFNVALGRTDKSMIGGEEKELFDRAYSANLMVFYDPKVVVFHSVPVERTFPVFVRRQAIGIGMSERFRTRNKSVQLYVFRIVKEIIFWAGSLVLFLSFVLKSQLPKAKMIIKFRFWLSQGLLGIKEE
jgi:glycosyltransferase involved in cell wall biosynthesis